MNGSPAFLELMVLSSGVPLRKREESGTSFTMLIMDSEACGKEMPPESVLRRERDVD
jgi:hypothetical protein